VAFLSQLGVMCEYRRQFLWEDSRPHSPLFRKRRYCRLTTVFTALMFSIASLSSFGLYPASEQRAFSRSSN
jgi:hypothetical protein